MLLLSVSVQLLDATAQCQCSVIGCYCSVSVLSDWVLLLSVNAQWQGATAQWLSDRMLLLSVSAQWLGDRVPSYWVLLLSG